MGSAQTFSVPASREHHQHCRYASGYDYTQKKKNDDRQSYEHRHSVTAAGTVVDDE